MDSFGYGHRDVVGFAKRLHNDTMVRMSLLAGVGRQIWSRGWAAAVDHRIGPPD